MSVQARLISTDHGLASNYVLRVLQGKDGQMWISTSEGLDAYDGEAFEHFTAQRDGLPSNQNNILFEDAEGRLWVGVAPRREVQGVIGYDKPRIVVFDPVRKKVNPFSACFGELAPMKESDIFGIRMDSLKCLWIGTLQGKVYRYTEGRFELVLDNGGAFPLAGAIPVAEGGFWALGPHAVLRLDKTGGVLESDSLPFLPNRLVPLSGGGVLIPGGYSGQPVQWHSLVKYPGQALSSTFRLQGGSTVDFRDVLFVGESPGPVIWCMKDKNLVAYDGSGAPVFDMNKQFPQYCRFSPGNFPFFSQNGLVWAPLVDGIMLIKLQKRYFREFLSEERASIRGMIGLPDGRLLVNSYKSAFILDPVKGDYRPIPQYYNGLGLCYGPEGSIWIGRHEHKVYNYDIKSGRFTPFEIYGAPSRAEAIQPFVSRSGTTWLGTSAGLARFDTLDKVFTMCDELNEDHGLADKAINFFLEDESGIFMATSSGLFLLHPDEEAITPIASLPGFEFYHIYRKAPNQYWLASRGDGLIHWDVGTGLYRRYTVDDGLPSNIVYAVYPDSNDFLWLSTKDGLCAFNPRREELHVFLRSSGLPFNEFNFMAHYQAADGTLYFGGLNGIVAFQPEDVPLGQGNRSYLRVTRFQQFNRKEGRMEDRTDAFLQAPEIIMRPGERFINLDFVLQDYLAPEKNRYAYRINGLDDHWHYLQESFLRLNALPYGSYFLQVKAMGHDGEWTKDLMVIPIRVPRPWAATWWFWLGVGILALLLAYLVFQLRLRSLKLAKRRLEREVDQRTAQIEANLQLIARQKDELEASNRAKDKLFSIIGHELRGPLMFFWNIGARVGFLLKQNRREELIQLGQTAEEVTKSLNATLENLMHWGLIQSGQFPTHKEAFPVGEEMEKVAQALRPVARKKRVQLICSPPPPGLMAEMDRTGFEIVLRNLVSNGIKFTYPRGTVSVSACEKGGQVELQVKDTGKGMSREHAEAIMRMDIPRSSKGTEGERGAGLGLNITQEILKRNAGSMAIVSGDKQGATFVVTFPAATAQRK